MFKKYLSKSNNEDLSQATESKEHENDDEVYNIII